MHCLSEKVMLGSYFSGLAAHLLSSSDDKLVLDLVGRVLHQREVEQGPGEENDDHGVGDGQDKLGREFARGAGGDLGQRGGGRDVGAGDQAQDQACDHPPVQAHLGDFCWS